MMFMQQSKYELCVLSASGSISNASLRQPATSGGSITYEVENFLPMWLAMGSTEFADKHKSRIKKIQELII